MGARPRITGEMEKLVLQRCLLPLLLAMLTSVALPTAGDAQAETLLFDHLQLAAPEPEAAASWYMEHFGGEYVDGLTDQIMIGTTRLRFVGDASARPSSGSAIDHIGFSVDDLPAKVRELEAAGATTTLDPREAEGLFLIAFVDDPWGVRIELVQDPQHPGLHHVHLRTPDIENTMQWYLRAVGGVRTSMRGARDAVLYPGNVWLMFAAGEPAIDERSALRGIGWRVRDLERKVAELGQRGVRATEMVVAAPSADLAARAAFIVGPDGQRVALVQRAPTAR